MSIPETEITTCLVEFGPLDDEQRALVDLHPMRAVGTEATFETGDGVVIEFWLGAGEQPSTVFDDIRGWAIGNRLPIRRLIA
ncbi:MAG TPA: hypothetical protein VGK49_07280 [Ilumatobacteraceae bacterium]